MSAPSHGLTVVVPVPHETQNPWVEGDGLVRAKSDLRSLGARVIVIGGPAVAPGLAAVNAGPYGLLRPELEVEVIPGPSAGSFFESAIPGLREAGCRGDHALLLSTDVLLFPDAVSEMLAGLAHDSMAGFVCPRSNNIPSTSLPPPRLHFEPPVHPSPDEAARLHADINRFLPRFSYMPSGSGLCMLIRWEILACFGLLERKRDCRGETGLLMRANRLGYRVLAANRAFVHRRSASPPAAPDQEEEALAAALYPEYRPACDAYRRTPQARAEVVFSEHSIRTGQGRTVELLVDASALSHLTNGTVRLVRLIAAALCRRAEGTDIRVSAMCSQEAARQNNLHEIPGLSIVPEQEAYGFDLLIKPWQPFASAVLRDNAARALKIAYFMLDTIAWDCLYLWNEDLDACWNLAGDCADALLFISPFGHEQFRRRFRVSPHVLTMVTPLSLDVGDYLPPGGAASPDAVRRDILVFGNSFFHKFVGPAVACLTSHFPEIRIVLFGMEEWPDPANVVAIPSGPLSQDELEKIFASALCLVYPSTYEGFGLPIMEGLARGIPVIARDSELNRWIASLANGTENLHLFRTFEDLVAKISEVLDAPSGAGRIASEPPLPAPAWDEVMDGLWHALTRLARSDDLTQFHHRKEFLRLPPPPPPPPPEPPPEPPAPPPPSTVVLKSERAKRPVAVRLAREFRRALRKGGLWRLPPACNSGAPPEEDMPPPPHGK